MTSQQQFWRAREVPPGRTCLWRLGALRLWIQRVEGGWRFAKESGTSFDQMNASVVPNDVVPMELTWTSLPGECGDHFFLRPELPDRPVVAKPEERVIVPAGERVTYYCLLPCWARFFLGKDEKGNGAGRFGSWPTRALSDTWFGDHAEGVLAYALVFPAGRNWQDLPIGPHHVIVPVRIENNSVEHLDFERLCLRPQYLGVYAAGPALWSNAVDVTFQGAAHSSGLHYETSAPVETGKSAVPLTAPAERAHRSLVGFTFSGPASSDFRSNAL